MHAACIHTYIHMYKYIYVRLNIFAQIHQYILYIHAYIYTNIVIIHYTDKHTLHTAHAGRQAYVRTYIRMYIHAYTHIYIVILLYV